MGSVEFHAQEPIKMPNYLTANDKDLTNTLLQTCNENRVLYQKVLFI